MNIVYCTLFDNGMQRNFRFLSRQSYKTIKTKNTITVEAA